MHITTHRQRIYGLVKYYSANYHYSAKFNLFKVLRCYSIDYPETNQLSAVINELQQVIVQRCIDDIQHQFKHHGSQLQLGHIDLAIQHVPPSDFRTQQAKTIVQLAQQQGYAELQNTHLYETAKDISA